MTPSQWYPLIQQAAPFAVDRCVVLNTNSTDMDVRQAIELAGEDAISFAQRVVAGWSVQGSEMLLTGITNLLNPGISEAELDPTNQSMRVLFPDFCRILDHTAQFAVLVVPHESDDRPHLQILCAGICDGSIELGYADQPPYWVFYMPESSAVIRQYETSGDFVLSPQMRQFFLRANGAPDIVTPIQYMRKGALAEVYQDFWHRLMTRELFEQMGQFVPFFDDGAGNSQGFFPHIHSPDGEHIIFDWDHETVEFTVYQTNFSAWLKNQFETATE